MARGLEVGLNAAILAVTREQPRVLVIPESGKSTGGGQPAAALPFGPLDPEAHRTLELGLRAWVRRQTGLELGYVEQLYTFGDRDRSLRGGGRRVLSVAYLALVREREIERERDAVWRRIYDYLPWEDARDGRPELLSARVEPALGRWVESAAEPAERARRQERSDVAFGLNGAPWNTDRVLSRYELLYEASLVAEAARDRGEEPPRGVFGRPLALDHRRILATALGRLRGKIKYRPVVFELLPPTFTLFQLQRTVEALAGVRLHKANFRRLVDRTGLVEGTGALEPDTGGRPAELFRFRREVLRERPAPGVGLPRLPGVG